VLHVQLMATPRMSITTCGCTRIGGEESCKAKSHTQHIVIMTKQKARLTCMLVPAWAGSTPRFAKPNGSREPSMTLVITIANSEQPMAMAANGSWLVNSTLAEPAAAE